MRAVTFIASCLCISGIALAAVPPLSKEQLLERSTLIVTGTIKQLRTEVNVWGERRRDTIYRISLQIDAVEKGDANLNGRSIEITTWQPKERPAGWAGPQGQNITPVEGAAVRCYLSGPQKDAYALLLPNGLELLPSAATAPSTQPK